MVATEDLRGGLDSGGGNKGGSKGQGTDLNCIINLSWQVLTR
jgi:hypothetical protein